MFCWSTLLVLSDFLPLHIVVCSGSSHFTAVSFSHYTLWCVAALLMWIFLENIFDHFVQYSCTVPTSRYIPAHFLDIADISYKETWLRILYVFESNQLFEYNIKRDFYSDVYTILSRDLINNIDHILKRTLLLCIHHFKIRFDLQYGPYAHFGY